MAEFVPWPKIARFNRDTIVTEKIDGTNAAVLVEPVDNFDVSEDPFRLATVLVSSGNPLLTDLYMSTDIPAVVDAALPAHTEHFVGVYAQSRNRFLKPGVGKEAGQDNYGFAAFVTDNAPALVNLLGEGRHFGEWYGQSIARNYGLDHRRFALFNSTRWNSLGIKADTGGYCLDPDLRLDVVPVMSIDAHPSRAIDESIEWLRLYGSALVPGFDKPEGVVAYHTAAKTLFKVLLEGDELPKGKVTRSERLAKGVFDADA